MPAGGGAVGERRIDPGQLLMVGIPGPTIDAATRRRLLELRAAGVILFRRNVRTPAQVRRLCAALHQLTPQFLIGIDQEGGRVSRLPRPFTQFPPARAIGDRASSRLAFAIGQAMGRELASVGIDIDFAPVLDVLTHPRNRVIGDRAFAGVPSTVSAIALALAGGLQAAGIVPCGKHFPGHGGARGDSHVVLPRVARRRHDLWRIDLAPFRDAIAADIPALMVAHVLYRHLDSSAPASLSPRIVDRLLRHRLGFRGTIVSDDLEMGAVSHRLSPGEAAVRAVLAGNDLLLVCNNLDVAAQAHRGLRVALASGRLPAARARDALARIRRLRRPRSSRRSPITRWPVPAHAALVHAIGEP